MGLIINEAVRWAVSIANDATHGYSQDINIRWGNPDYDCSSLVISAWEHAGVPVKTKGASWTGDMRSIFLANGFLDVTSQVNFSTGSGLQTGDVLLRHNDETGNGHTALVDVNPPRLVEALSSENGGKYGDPGDQTGREIVRDNNYRNSPWNWCLRYQEVEAPIDWTRVISGNRGLTDAEKEINARIVWRWCKEQQPPWTDEAIAGFLGNADWESTLNPGRWQNGAVQIGPAFGFLQWDPWVQVTNYLGNRSIAWDNLQGQLDYFLYSIRNGDWGDYGNKEPQDYTFSQFTQSVESPERLAWIFMVFYERPGAPHLDQRETAARKWYDLLHGTGGGGTTLPPTPSNPVFPKRKRLIISL